MSPVSAVGAVIALAVILAADLIHFGHGERSLLAAGPLDEVAHLATGCGASWLEPCAGALPAPW